MATETPPQAVTATIEPVQPRSFLEKFAAVSSDAAGLLERFGASELAQKLGLRDHAEKAKALDAKGKAAKEAYEASSIPSVIDGVKKTLAKAEVAKRGGGKRRSILGHK